MFKIGVAMPAFSVRPVHSTTQIGDSRFLFNQHREIRLEKGKLLKKRKLIYLPYRLAIAYSLTLMGLARNQLHIVSLSLIMGNRKDSLLNRHHK